MLLGEAFQAFGGFFPSFLDKPFKLLGEFFQASKRSFSREKSPKGEASYLLGQDFWDKTSELLG